jgi:hypothetical protein
MTTEVHETEPKQSEFSDQTWDAFYTLTNIYIKGT